MAAASHPPSADPGPETPPRAREDRDENWGDPPDDREAHFEENRPPHHDRDPGR